ncbi:hypothetical protein ABEZ87_10650, partial [Bacillus mycoides]
GKSKSVVQYSPSATIQESEEMDLFGYMKTVKGDMGVLCKQEVQRNAEKSAEACSYLFKS